MSTRSSADPSSTTPPSGEVVSNGGSHLARNVAIVVGLVLVVFILVLATRPTGDDAVNTTAVGRAVPPVVGTTLDGEAFDIDRLRGNWVVVNFFATWCVPCIVEHPELVRFSEGHAAAGDGVSIVAVQFGGEQEVEIRAFFDQRGGDWPVLVGEGTGRIALDFGVTAVPESYLVAPNGQVVAKYVSGVTAAGLDAEIDRYEAAAGDEGEAS